MKLSNLLENERFNVGDVVSSREGTHIIMKIGDGYYVVGILLVPAHVKNWYFHGEHRMYLMEKEDVIKYLLKSITRNDMDLKSHVLDAIKVLRKYGKDWPELNAIEKSLRVK